MNNSKLLTGLLVAVLGAGYACASEPEGTVYGLEDLFRIAETQSVQLRPSFTGQQESQQEIRVAKSAWLPDIKADLSLSYNGDGFTLKRNFTDYQKAPIPHFGNGLNVSVEQPLYTGGAIQSGIRMAELKSKASDCVTEVNRDNLRFQLTGLYLDLYKTGNLREVLDKNIAQAEKVLDEMRSRYSQGMALQNDITRYELLLSNLQFQRVKLNNTMEILHRHLAVTAGLPPETRILPDTTLLDKALPTEGEETWQQEGNRLSPVLRLAQTEVDINRQA